MKTILWIITFSFTLKGFSQDSLLINYAIESWNDIVNNVKGGIKQGTVYKGLLAIDPKISYKNFGYNASFLYSFGKSPTNELVGDLHVLSNIDANPGFYIYESYFYTTIKRLKIKAGIINMNEEFICCEKDANLLINSSFGIPSLVTRNIPVSVYPITSFGCDILYNLNYKNKIKFGIYDGFPKKITSKKFNSGINFNNGILAISEFHKNLNNFNFKLGFYNHFGSFNKSDSSNYINPHNALYSIIYGDIINLNKHNISGFLQYSNSIFYKTNLNFYLGTGLSLNFNYKSNKLNKLIVGVVYVADKIFSNYNETVYEISYVRTILKYFTLQPNIQYVVNPLGYFEPLENALTFNFRLLFVIER